VLNCSQNVRRLYRLTNVSIASLLVNPYNHHHQSELVGDVAVPVSVRQAVLF